MSPLSASHVGRLLMGGAAEAELFLYELLRSNCRAGGPVRGCERFDPLAAPRLRLQLVLWIMTRRASIDHSCAGDFWRRRRLADAVLRSKRKAHVLAEKSVPAAVLLAHIDRCSMREKPKRVNRAGRNRLWCRLAQPAGCRLTLSRKPEQLSARATESQRALCDDLRLLNAACTQ